MKKIIAIILAITCVFALFSCGDDGVEADVASINEMYKNSAPTLTVVETTQDFGSGDPLEGRYVLQTGKVGGAVATVYTYSYEVLRSVEDGAGSEIKKVQEAITGSKEFLEGKGVRENGGQWNPDGYNFAPLAGAMALNLDMKNLTDPVYANNTLNFKVAVDKAQEVFGTIINNDLEEDAIAADLEVEIKHAGSVITSVVIKYAITGEDDYPDSQVIVKATYSYDLQKITMK